MVVRTHTFGQMGTLTSTHLAGDDEGEPPADPRVRVTKVDTGGEIVSSSSPDGPDEIEAKRAAAAAKLASRPVLPVVVSPDADTPELRKFCLELAARGATESSDIVDAARKFRDFVLRGG